MQDSLRRIPLSQLLLDITIAGNLQLELSILDISLYNTVVSGLLTFFSQDFLTMRSRWNLKAKVFAIFFSMLIVSEILLACFIISFLVRGSEERFSEFRNNEIIKAKNRLQDQINNAFTIIETKYRNATEHGFLQKHYEQVLINAMDFVESIINSKKDAIKRGETDLKTAQKTAMRAIRRMRYNKGAGYFFITDTSEPYPLVLMHPIMPDKIENRHMDLDLYYCVQPGNKHLGKTYIEISKSDEGEGFVFYLWPRKDPKDLDDKVPKLSYIRFIPEWNWLIGTGITIDDTIERAKETSMDILRQMRWDNEVGYFWINDMGKPYPEMIMHPTIPATEGTIMDDPRYNCASGRRKNLFQAFIEICEQQGEGYVNYLWPKPVAGGVTEEDRPKLSYVRMFKTIRLDYRRRHVS